MTREETESLEVAPTEEPASIEEQLAPPPTEIHPEARIVHRPIPSSLLDPEAVKVVHRLTRYGHAAYLVGGCVRDILLDRLPKDFDVVTSAMPAEVRRLFGNCRLIGRRFRLAHLHFKNGKIIEVATFRRAPTSLDELTGKHAAENLFGGPADDAMRRDFTINALMYDVARSEIHDWVGGLEDLGRGLLRTIGDPRERIPEDPVRMIRAVKFAERLGLEIDPPLRDAIRENAPLITRSALPRLVEEILKLLRSGCAARCMSAARKFDLLTHLMPGLAAHIDGLRSPDDFWALLARVDEAQRAGTPATDQLLLAVMLFDACRALLEAEGDTSADLGTRLASLVAPMPFTRRHMAGVRQILFAQRRLQRGPRSRRDRRLLERDFAADAIALLAMTATTPEQAALAEAWRKTSAGEPPRQPQPESAHKPRRRRRPRRTRKPVEEA